jgi:hypothetical protein
MTTLLFEERQFFRQAWLWIIWGILTVVVVVAVAPEREAVRWISLGGTLAIGLFLLTMNMTVTVDTEFVRIRYFPLWRKTISLDQIVRWEARTYRPILEYGGWGIRYNFRRGWAYNVSGNQGVQLELANGKRILIGSQRAEELARAIGDAKGQS